MEIMEISNGHRALKDINSRRGRGKWYLPCFQSPFLDIRPFLRRSTKKALSFLTELLLWRREGDSNPRDGIRRQHDFQSCTLNRSDTSPCCLFLALRPAPCCFHQWLTDLCSIPTDASYVKHFLKIFLMKWFYSWKRFPVVVAHHTAMKGRKLFDNSFLWMWHTILPCHTGSFSLIVSYGDDTLSPHAGQEAFRKWFPTEVTHHTAHVGQETFREWFPMNVTHHTAHDGQETFR